MTITDLAHQPPRLSVSGPPAPDFTITPAGAFSLMEAGTFGFGQRPAPSYDGVMRLAFCVDGYQEQAAVALRQDGGGVHGWVQGGGALDRVRAQVARVLSLDHDYRGFEEVGRRDPVIGRLQAVAPGLRPPLFYSPYEAAAWCVLSARRPIAQMDELRRRLSEAHGRAFEVAGRRLVAFPTPAQLLGVEQFPGISETKLRRLHGVARAAIDWRLDAEGLQALSVAEATAQLCRLEGIGPWYASLILVRASGLTDVLPLGEARLEGLVQQLYHLQRPPSPDQLNALAEAWRPFRTWAAVLIRAASRRLA